MQTLKKIYIATKRFKQETNTFAPTPYDGFLCCWNWTVCSKVGTGGQLTSGLHTWCVRILETQQRTQCKFRSPEHRHGSTWPFTDVLLELVGNLYGRPQLQKRVRSEQVVTERWQQKDSATTQALPHKVHVFKNLCHDFAPCRRLACRNSRWWPRFFVLQRKIWRNIWTWRWGRVRRWEHKSTCWGARSCVRTTRVGV